MSINDGMDAGISILFYRCGQIANREEAINAPMTQIASQGINQQIFIFRAQICLRKGQIKSDHHAALFTAEVTSSICAADLKNHHIPRFGLK